MKENIKIDDFKQRGCNLHSTQPSPAALLADRAEALMSRLPRLTTPALIRLKKEIDAMTTTTSKKEMGNGKDN